MTAIVGLGHRARHGKNYIARSLVGAAIAEGYYAKEYGFADALKVYCRVAFGMREKDPRLLQIVGTDIFRRFDADVWVRVLMDTIEEQKPDVAVITDMRFPNEAQAIRRRGGLCVKVERRNANGTLWIAKDRDPNHESEIALTDYPFDQTVACYDGDLAGLEAAGVALWRQVAQTLRKVA